MESTLNTPQTWLVVADGERAVVYTRHRSERFIPLRAKQEATHSHYTATTAWELKPVRELKAESRDAYALEQNEGRSFDSVGMGRHRTGDKEPLRQHIARAFMDDLADMLNEAFAQQEFARLVITAPPKLLGELRPRLDAPVQEAVIAELPKNLSHETPGRLAELLAESLKGVAAN